MNSVNPVSVRIPADLRAWIEAKASDESRSMSGQIIQTLKAAMAAETQKEKAQ